MNAASSLVSYAPPPRDAGLRLLLDSNEGRPSPFLVERLRAAVDSAAMARYPRAAELEARLAERPAELQAEPSAEPSAKPSAKPSALGKRVLRPEEVLVTAGADDAIARACRAFLGAGDRLLVFEPAFEMFSVSARAAGGKVVGVPWPGAAPFPLEDAVRVARNNKVRVIALASPANPTGGAASNEEIGELLDAVPDVTVLVDSAYSEFAQEDPTAAALSRPNAVVLRTFSKAYGLAGLRLGWAAGPAALIGAMRSAGGPYPVAGLAIRAGLAAASPEGESGMRAYVDKVRAERDRLFQVMRGLGALPYPSQANFIAAEVGDAAGLARSLASAGIAIRSFAGRPGLENVVRITCPGDEGDFGALVSALRESVGSVEVAS